MIFFFAVKKPKKSVKDVFKMGLFLSKKSRKKSSLATATKSVQPFPSPGQIVHYYFSNCVQENQEVQAAKCDSAQS